MHFNINSYGRLYVCTVVDFGNSIRPAFYRHSHFEHCLKVSNWIWNRLNGGLWNEFLYKKNHEIFGFKEFIQFFTVYLRPRKLIGPLLQYNEA